MAEDINLLPEISEEEAKKGAQKRTVNTAAIASLLVVAVILLALFGYQLFLAASATRIEAQTRAAEEQILAQARKEATHRLLVEKLEKASQFLANALPYSEGHSLLTNILKKCECTLTEAVFKDDGGLSISGDAGSSSNLEKLVTGLTSEETSEAFGRANMDTLVKQSPDPYKFTIDVKFLKKGLHEQ